MPALPGSASCLLTSISTMKQAGCLRSQALEVSRQGLSAARHDVGPRFVILARGGALELRVILAA
jgi:hypothetical protein